mgnify:CR=1 FL=1
MQHENVTGRKGETGEGKVSDGPLSKEETYEKHERAKKQYEREMKELNLVKSQPSIVAMGIVSNVGLLLFPEIVFYPLYASGISEVGFYFE